MGDRAQKPHRECPEALKASPPADAVGAAVLAMRIAIRAVGNRQSSIPCKIDQGRSGALKPSWTKISAPGATRLVGALR
jgi:hypothetical protein